MKYLPLLILAACAHPDRTIRTLEEGGFTDIRLEERRRHLCAENEDFAHGFAARYEGKDVTGVVCHEPFGDDVVKFKHR